MKYKQLSQTYRDDTLAEAMYAREVEYFHYDFDRANFSTMLETLPAESEFRALIQARHDQTLLQMENVERVYAALEARVTDPAAHDAAILRATAKREAAATEQRKPK